jgi:hypothetical protein
MNQYEINTVEIDGNVYEVLDLTNPESIKLITHAKLAGGKVLEIVGIEDDSFEVRLSDGSDFYFSSASFQDLDIQPLQLLSKPLRLVPKEPVTFEGQVTRVDGGNCYVDMIAVDCAGAKPGMRFLCTEIVEEEAHAILKAKGVEV